MREEEFNGRMYDSSRIIEIDNCKKFYIGVMYVQADELRMFEAFPEVLVMDSKAKTNDLRQAYFAGIGVDSFWLNNTLFRSWIPNQTDTSYMWLTTIALPALVPIRILKQVQSIFTDDDKVVNSGLKLLLAKEECFSDAEAYICGYHIVRNFHQEFGLGSKTKHRKGGEIQWLHPWQAHCANALYRGAQCETDDEIREWKHWIDRFIKTTKDIGRKELRRNVHKFFNRKFDKRKQWMLRYRMKRRTLNIKSTSRVEGEFSGVHAIKLSTNTRQKRAFQKLRFLAERRRHRKVRLSEYSLSKSSKKQSKVMSENEWQCLDKVMTPYYCVKIEAECARALNPNVKFQVLEKSADRVRVTMWCEHITGDAHADDADIVEEDDEEGGDDAAMAVDAAVPVEDGIKDVADKELESDNERNDIESDSDDDSGSVRSTPGNEECADGSGIEDSAEVEFAPFRYRRVRHILFHKTDDYNFEIECDCGFFNRTCVTCRHILRLLKEILGSWGFNTQKWHRRLLKKFYSDVLTTVKRVGGSKMRVVPTIAADALMQWLLQQEASSEGVPRPGIVGTDDAAAAADDGFHGDNGGDAYADADDGSKKRRRKGGGRSEEECTTKFSTIMFQCKNQPELRTSFYETMCDWQKTTDRCVPARGPGAPERNRTRGVADKPTGASKPKKRKKDAEKTDEPKHKKRKHKTKRTGPLQAAVSDVGCEGDNAIRHISKFGAKEGFIIEVYLPDDHPTPDDLWFARVETGLTYTDANSDVFVKKIKWLAPNNLTQLSKTHSKGVSCDVQSVKAYGPLKYFQTKYPQLQ